MLDAGIRLADDHTGGIDLLMTDVVMPGMNGQDLADRLQARHPRMASLFMSGYAAGAIAHRGLLEAHINFVPKPFSKKELAEKVRAALQGTGSAEG
jgi:FixJ family two-component response regulator